MVVHRIAGITAEIDAEETRRIYASMAEDRETGALKNFRWNVRQRKAAFDAYFLPLGIDPLKVRSLFVSEVDPYTQTVRCSGEYPVAAAFHGTDLERLEIMRDSAAWEWKTETEFGAELQYIFRGRRPEIYIDITFPWVLYPPIAVCRYANKARIPDEPTEEPVWRKREKTI
jgi:hypothetical protein